MTTLVEPNTSMGERINYLSNHLIVLPLNIHVELNDGRFSLTNLNEIRKHSDLSLLSSSFSNIFIDELLSCVEYYCHQVTELTDSLHLVIRSLLSITNLSQIMDDLSRGSQLCLDVIKIYHTDRMQAVQSMLSSPYREDAWHFVYELDSTIFSKCRIMLIRLRMYFLLMHQILFNDIKQKSPMSISNNSKRRKHVDFNV
ncbi:unnamed protein product [Rotaria socialis]|uniref:Proteasome activator PA28 C-terminal domain-containing protein n=1 Tax=Rotaria socialis TaxID=392032 RepID=A0A818E6L2_9BILA|nr:unnamed protein product [Rotaria socialis]CAF3444724.1 unnamed protein product [Rotaria socialis]CAF3479512.1 unnamed protein product [Rotaria socialis]CAF4265308.1 unnamed protein product [Rotaria socialis]CAF4408461.1 unnamed protein product [Rotaria socialis]